MYYSYDILLQNYSRRTPQVIDKNKKYELKELESMLYSAADTFHGSGNLNNL